MRNLKHGRIKKKERRLHNKDRNDPERSIGQELPAGTNLIGRVNKDGEQLHYRYFLNNTRIFAFVSAGAFLRSVRIAN
jgi:hypothetical protein